MCVHLFVYVVRVWERGERERGNVSLSKTSVGEKEIERTCGWFDNEPVNMTPFSA